MDTNQIILAVMCAVLVVFSLTVALVVPKRNPDFPAKRLAAFFGVSLLLVAGMLASVVVFGGEDTETVAATQPAATSPPASSGGADTGSGGESGAPPPGDPAAGKKIFLSAGCSGCHTLADAGSSGNVGPNLDDAKPPYDLVIDRVTNGKGVMPSFKGQLSEQQIQDVASYVSQATSG